MCPSNPLSVARPKTTRLTASIGNTSSHSPAGAPALAATFTSRSSNPAAANIRIATTGHAASSRTPPIQDRNRPALPHPASAAGSNSAASVSPVRNGSFASDSFQESLA